MISQIKEQTFVYCHIVAHYECDTLSRAHATPPPHLLNMEITDLSLSVSNFYNFTGENNYTAEKYKTYKLASVSVDVCGC